MDASDLEQTLWPRLAAVAESLWSPRNVTACAPLFNNMTHQPGLCANIDAALPRLEEFRCLLIRRGVAAGTVGGAVARDAWPCGLADV